MAFRLSDLEKAIRPQFVFRYQRENETFEEFERNRRHYLSTCAMAELNESMALIVFCGLAIEYGFTEYEVVKYLKISDVHFAQLESSFKRYKRKATEVEGNGRRVDRDKPYGKAHIKSSLVRSYIRMNYLIR